MPAPPLSSHPPSLELLLIGLQCLLVAIHLGLYLVYELHRWLGAQRWPTIPATVHHLTQGRTIRGLTARYEIEGIPCETDRLTLFPWVQWKGWDWASRLAHQHPAGSAITLRVDPAHPARALAADLPLPWDRIGLLILGIVIASAGAWGAVQPQPLSPYERWLMTMSPAEIQALLAQMPHGPPTLPYNALEALLLPVIRIGTVGLIFWTAWRLGQLWMWGRKSSDWPMVSSRIVGLHGWLREPRAQDGRPLPAREYLEVAYTYRAEEHRFEANRLTLFGDAYESWLPGTELPFPDGAELDAVIPGYHRPGKPAESLLIPGVRAIGRKYWTRMAQGLWWLVVLFAIAEFLTAQ